MLVTSPPHPQAPKNFGDEEIKRESLRADADVAFSELKWDVISKSKKAVISIFTFPEQDCVLFF